MPYALSWFVVASVVALWSLSVWALHEVAVWTVSSAGALSGAAASAAEWAFPAWLAPWVPSEVAHATGRLLASLAPVVEGLLQAAPSLAGGVTVAAWAVWGLGGVLLGLVGAGLHVLIALWRRRGPESHPHAPSSLSTG